MDNIKKVFVSFDVHTIDLNINLEEKFIEMENVKKEMSLVFLLDIINKLKKISVIYEKPTFKICATIQFVGDEIKNYYIPINSMGYHGILEIMENIKEVL